MDTIGRVARATFSCDACYDFIDEDNWFSFVEHDGKIYRIHDGPYCIEHLKLRLGLGKPSFWTSVNPGWVNQGFSRRVSRHRILMKF